MPRARKTQYMQTAAATQENGSGCSFFVLPPLAVLVISAVLAVLALNHPTNVQLVESRSPVLDTPSPAAVVQSPADQSAVQPTEAVSSLFDFSQSSGTASQASGISPIFTPSVQYWSSSILGWAAAANVDPNLAATVMQIESCGDPRATSRSGAMGLFQVMPFHFYSTDSPYDPDANALRGLNYLARSLEKAGGDPRLALAGYNGGIGVISRAEWAWPAETKRYVYYGAPIYEDARNGVASSAMVEEWYNKYGASLCRQASQRIGLP